MIPETNNRKDWPRLVSNEVKQIERRLKDVEGGNNISRAAAFFYQ